ncbi:MAG TPA: hypothetical protein VFE46_04230 [Pirellulales bacterium]|jgi:hypothetical protein|nr:hypothetical protein [Pirellulales bacterium]
MICYFDGQPVQLGDSVDFDGEPATVMEIIQTQEQATAEGLPEPMVGFQTERLGAVYQAPSDRGWDGIILLSRAPSHI